jgi:hypothetical protein
MFNIRSSPHLVCPQCNNYNATLHSTMTRGELTLLFLSTFLVIPPLFLSRHFHRRDERRFFEGANQATCRSCGCTFTIKEVANLPQDMLKKLLHHSFNKYQGKS